MPKSEKKQYTYIDGTTVCPACGKEMDRFQYTLNSVSNVAVNQKTNWEQMKKTTTTTWKERTYRSGKGYMCPHCYKKRQTVFWIVFSILCAALIACIVLGRVLSIQPLFIGGLGVLAVTLLFAYSKSGQELIDLKALFRRKVNPEHEFLAFFAKEHRELIADPTDMIRVKEDK